MLKYIPHVTALVLVFFLGQYTAPIPECPEITTDTLTVVEYREVVKTDTVLVTAAVIGDAIIEDPGVIFTPEILRVDTTFADSAEIVLTINEATNVVDMEYTPAPIRVKEVTINNVVHEIKEVPMPIPTVEKAKLIAVGAGIGIVISAALLLL
ncbi:MAG: hypothetical protein H8D23_17835 [Candidatus Brocadiales bacterium]|nr:hypothetical protein [Candidatus Brocadiales bacterium]